jgi:hypothetical protein
VDVDEQTLGASVLDVVATTNQDRSKSAKWLLKRPRLCVCEALDQGLGMAGQGLPFILLALWPPNNACLADTAGPVHFHYGGQAMVDSSLTRPLHRIARCCMLHRSASGPLLQRRCRPHPGTLRDIAAGDAKWGTSSCSLPRRTPRCQIVLQRRIYPFHICASLARNSEDWTGRCPADFCGVESLDRLPRAFVQSCSEPGRRLIADDPARKQSEGIEPADGGTVNFGQGLASAKSDGAS